MRTVILNRRAERALDNICKFIESKNLPDSSDKWLSEILGFIIEYASLNINHPLCNNRLLAKQKLSCITFNKKWVIAFRVTKTNFRVYQIINGSNLK